MLNTCICVQMENLLRENGVPFVSVTLQSVYVASVSLTFQVALNSTVNNYEDRLSQFLTYFNTELDTFADYFVLEGGRGTLGVIPSGTVNLISIYAVIQCHILYMLYTYFPGQIYISSDVSRECLFIKHLLIAGYIKRHVIWCIILHITVCISRASLKYLYVLAKQRLILFILVAMRPFS